jgi:hypothetical protein
MGGGTNISFFSAAGNTDCSLTTIRTQLFSPDPKVLKKITVGDNLNIQLANPSGPCVALYKGNIAGTIISKDLMQLINCIKKGFQFIAVVRSLSGGSCAVTIKTLK